MRLFNLAESIVWLVIAIYFFCFSRKGTRFKSNYLILSIVFVLFGISDLIEIQTGAWWRPFSLLIYKGACLLIILINLFVIKIKR